MSRKAKPMGLKQMRVQLNRLKEIRRHATMASANFDGVANTTALTDMIREKTKLYRQTWLIYPLDSIIAEYEVLLALKQKEQKE